MPVLPFAAAAGDPLTPGKLLTGWTFAPLPLAALLVAVYGYLVGVRRLSRHRRHWPAGRTVCFMSGCAFLALAFESGLAAYDERYFSVHVSQHLILAMIGPPLLALGAPVTLALQAGSRRTQRRLLRVLHSPPMAVLTHPLVVWALFAGSLFALYFSELYPLSLRHPAVHDLVHVHFLVVGILFFWPVVGLDPGIWRLPHGARLLYVFVALPFHAFLGIALLSGQAPLFEAHTLGDQHAGGAILWGVGDLLSLVAVAVVLTQWMAADRRTAAQEDRVLGHAELVGGREASPGGNAG